MTSKLFRTDDRNTLLSYLSVAILQLIRIVKLW